MPKNVRCVAGVLAMTRAAPLPIDSDGPYFGLGLGEMDIFALVFFGDLQPWLGL